MTATARRGIWGGVAVGILACLVVVGVLYLLGFRLMRHGAETAAPKERKILCYVSPNDANFVRQAPGKDDKGQELVPVYSSEGGTTAAMPGGERKIKYWVSPMDPGFVSDKPGKAPCGMDLVPVYEDRPAAPVAQGEKKERKIKYWVSPMDPGFVSDKPGKAPCGMDLVPVYEEAGDQAAPGTIAVDPNIMQSMGVRYGRAEVRSLTHTIRAVGIVGADEQRIAEVTTKVAGWVDKLYARVTGEPIRRGQHLISIYSPELVATQQEYLLARKNARAQKDNPFPEMREGAQRLAEASRQRLLYWDISPAQIEELGRTGEVRKHLILASPVSGIVTKRNVTQGQMVAPGMPLLEVVDLSQVWVDAEVYEYELPWIKVGQPATVTLTARPGEILRGKVEYVYPYMKNATRTARVRLAFANPGLKLKPEMYAQVEMHTALPQPVVTVPREAVMDTGAKQHVFLALGKGQFAPREVKLGISGNDGLVQVLEGLNGGEEVVTSAQFLLDSESRFREAIALMLGSQPGAGGTAAPGAGPAMPMPPAAAPAPAQPPGHRH